VLRKGSFYLLHLSFRVFRVVLGVSAGSPTDTL